MKVKILNLIVILILVALASACGRTQEEQKENKARFVKTEQISGVHSVSEKTYNGFIKERSLTTLSFRVGGPLVELSVKTGDYVKKGDVIGRIDTRDYKLQLESAELQLKQIEGEFNRYKELYAKQKVPANSYEKVESGYKLAKTQFRNASNQLKDTRLFAPVSGYVFEKMVENYQTVGPGQPIVSILDVSVVDVVVSVPENALSSLKESNLAMVNVANADVENIPVSLKSIGKKTLKDGMYQVKYQMVNNDSVGVYPGMIAKLRLITPLKDNKVTVPVSSLIRKNGKTFVWKYSNSGAVKLQEVKVATDILNERITVEKGLKHNDVVVTAGVNYLTEGEVVKPMKKVSKSNIGGLL